MCKEKVQASRDSIRPIDAYALDEAVVACEHIDRDSVRALIADAPVVEVQAVKYGVWEPVTEEIIIPGGAKAQSLTGYRCPQCGKDICNLFFNHNAHGGARCSITGKCGSGV